MLGETRSRASTTFLCGQALGEEHHMVYSESISKHRDEFGISPCWEHSEGKFWVSQALAHITHTVTTIVKGTANPLWAPPAAGASRAWVCHGLCTAQAHPLCQEWLAASEQWLGFKWRPYEMAADCRHSPPWCFLVNAAFSYAKARRILLEK